MQSSCAKGADQGLAEEERRFFDQFSPNSSVDPPRRRLRTIYVYAISHLSHSNLQKLALLALCLVAAVFAEQEALLLVGKTLVNKVAAQNQDLVVKYTVYNVGEGCVLCLCGRASVCWAAR